MIAYVIWGRVDHYLLASEVDGMRSSAKEIQDDLDSRKKDRVNTAEIRKWVDQDTVWLDEMCGLSRGMPPARDAMLGEFTASSGPRGSQMDIKGWTRKYDNIAEMEEGLRLLAGNMNTKDSHEDKNSPPGYAWSFDASIIVVEKEPGKEPAKTQAAAPAKPSAAAGASPGTSAAQSKLPSPSGRAAGSEGSGTGSKANSSANPLQKADGTASPPAKPSTTGAAMKLQKREKIMLGAAAGAIVLAGLTVFIMTGDSRPDEVLLKDKETLKVELEKKQKEKRQADEDARRLADWKRRSLPSNASIARSLYQDWLRVLCDRAGLRNWSVHSEETESHLKVYTRIPFSIHAHATLPEIVAFLHGFYSAGHLHQIRRLHIAPPLPGAKDTTFDLNIAIEAISLPDAASKDHLATEKGQELKLPQLAAYHEAIEGRNFFAAYVPKPPTGGNTDRTVSIDPPQKLDFAKFAVVTGFTNDEEDGIWRVWLQDRIAGRGKTWKLKEGEQFKVGGGTGQIGTIMAPEGDVILRFDGKVRELHLGEDLRGGKEIKE